jgi:hypothetical protein
MAEPAQIGYFVQDDPAAVNPTQVAAFLDQPDRDISYPGGHPRITVRPPARPAKPSEKPPARSTTPAPGGGGVRSVEDLPEYVDPSVPPAAAAAPGQKAPSVEDLPDYVDTSVPMQPEREVGFGQAAAAGARAGVVPGFEPAVQGLKAAGQAPGGGLIDQIAGGIARGADITNPVRPIADLLGLPQDHEIVQGIARLVMDKIQGTSQATGAYTQGRDTAQETQDLAAKQHPWAYYPSMVAGSLALPVPALKGGAAAVDALRAAHAVEAARAAGAAPGAVHFLAEQAAQAASKARAVQIGQTAATGATLGGVQGVGEGVSRGESLPEIAAGGAKGAIVGGVVGGGVGAVLPRVAPRAPAVLSEGQRAAQTAADLKGSIPRGLASDKGWLQTFTAGMKSFPLFGSRISHQVGDVQERAGNRLHEIATDLTGGSTNRAAAGEAVRKGADTASENVTKIIRQSYKNVFNKVDQTTQFPMPRTQAALRQIKAERVEKGWEDPGLGLKQWENVSEGATVKGAQGARSEASSKGGGINPHPGFDAGHYNLLTKAMTDDLRANVYAAAHGDAAAKQAALDAFDRADRLFGPFSEFNRFLRDIAEDNGESAIARLMSKAQEKTGDLTLLAQLRATMPPEAFNQIGGQVLHELGNQQGQFSLAKFVTEYDKLSPKARDLLFSPQHRQDIDNIFQMGSHIKGALKTANTSHTAAPLILLDLARDAVMTGAGVAVGAISGAGVAASAAAAAPGVVFAHWVSGPATARAVSNWTTAYRAATLGVPTPARIAAFKIATRNLAHNLNIPVEDVTRTIQQHLPAAAQPSQDNERPKVPGPR